MAFRPLSIVQVLAAPFPTRQGSQVYLQGLVRALARRGHRVTLACYGHSDGSDPPPGVTLVRTPRLPGYRNLRAGPDLVKPLLDAALATLVARLVPHADLLHAHNYEAPLAAWLGRAGRPVPVVYSAHNTLGEELPTYFRGRSSRWLASRAGNLLDRQVPRRADATLVLSERAVQALRDLGCPRPRCIPPGVAVEDLEGACPARARAAYELSHRAWVVYAGNPDAYQDLEILVRAVARVPHLGLILASAASLEPWERVCGNLGIGRERRRMVMTGSWPEVRDLVAAADLAALPRTVCAGFPMKVLNYLGLGRPTVAARGSAPPIPGVVAVPDGNAQAMAAAMRDLAGNAAYRQALGEAGRRAVRTAWTWDSRVGSFEDVYEEVLAHRLEDRA